MQVVSDSSVELEIAFFEPTSNRHGTDIKPTGERPEATLKATLEDRIVSGTCAFSMSYSIVNELGSRVPRGLGEAKKNVRELFFFCLSAYLSGQAAPPGLAACAIERCERPSPQADGAG